MNTFNLAAPRVLAPLHDLWRWLSHEPLPQTPLSNEMLIAPHHSKLGLPFAAKSPKVQPRSTQASRKPLRIIRILESDHVPTDVGRMVISGRMADVCAELDRLADCEGLFH